MKPNLIIQMQRIGDLILSFPLALKLLQKEPDRPVWVVAEPIFYQALMSLAPRVVFIPPSAEILYTTEFKTVINLSHRQESAKLTGKIFAEEKIGYALENNALFIKGFWQLYRASLTNNSRHNLFHWADLNCLDILSQDEMKTLPLSKAKAIRNQGKIGLFLGASSPYKRPEPEFFAKLAEKLIHLGYKPVFLGGKAEKELGEYINKKTGLHQQNLVDKFTLAELVFFMQELDLLITPDTGPMHIAAAYTIPTLTLSMGNVNPFETSVAPANHHVLQANLSCNSCWECSRNYQCKQQFTTSKVSLFVKALLEGKEFITVPNLTAYKTARTDGLHDLLPISSTIQHEKNARYHLSKFWQSYFLRISPKTYTSNNYNFKQLEENLPSIIPYFHKSHLKLFKDLRSCLKKNENLSPNFWQEQPVFMRQFTNFLQLHLENNQYSLESYQIAFSYLEKLTH